MKKIRDFILEGKEIYVGLEDSAKTWKVCVRSGRTVVHETSMEAKYENLHNYFRNKFPKCKIRVMYEAGFRGFELHDRLVADGWECVVTPPHTLTEEKCNKKKNDRNDCRRMAKNNENGDYNICHVPPRQQREDRQVSRLYGQMQKDISRECNRIRRTIEFHGLDRYFPCGEWNRTQYREAEERIKTLDISDSLKFTFATLFDTVRYLRKQRCLVLRHLRAIAKQDKYRKNVELLRGVPGIAFPTAIRLVLEWGDVSRFKRKEEFSAFLGLIPSDYSTGEQDHKGHITKQGNQQVRAWLIESSWVAIRFDPVLLEKYRKVLSHCGSSKKAIVAVARKLAMRLRSILLSGEPYQIGLEECQPA
jgi:transposase